MAVQLTIKLPERLRRQARSVAALRGETVSDIVRVALEVYVVQNQAMALQQVMEGHALTEGDPFLELVGIGEGGPADLSSDIHRYAVE